jgi:hypothetical protein
VQHKGRANPGGRTVDGFRQSPSRFCEPRRVAASGRQSSEPTREPRPIFLFHGYEFHAHAFAGPTSLHRRARAHLPCRRIEQQLNEGSRCWRIGSPDEQPAQAKVVYCRDHSLGGALPSDNRPSRGRKARINTTFTSLGWHQRFPPLQDGDPTTPRRPLPIAHARLMPEQRRSRRRGSVIVSGKAACRASNAPVDSMSVIHIDVSVAETDLG